MTLDATKPTDIEEISSHASYIREARAEINDFTSSIDFDQTDLTISAGVTSLAVGIDLSVAKLEVVNVDADAVVNIANITGGSAGQIKVFIAEDSNVMFTHNATGETSGVIRLNQPAHVTEYNLSQGDVFVLCNVGGSNGYWKELFRTLYVG